MRLRLLGVVEVVDDSGLRLLLGPRKQRLLLAVLACRPGETVQTAELVDALWGEQPPASAGENLRAYVGGLRGALGRNLVVGQRRLGYALAMDLCDIDTIDFVRSARDGKAALKRGDLAAARTLLHHGLDLWRGRPFADLGSVAPLAAEAARLDEYWLTTMEDRLDADLQAGAAGELIAELDDLTRRHPYREPLYRLLMLAQYRAGRRADALATYRRARAVLVADLGIEPTDELRQTEQGILRSEPWLERLKLEMSTATPCVTPAELPADVYGFTARDAELRLLDDLTARSTAASPAPAVAIVGVAGVGKTALAVHWGHAAINRFPDGQLFLDLRGFHHEAPLQPNEALARLLRSLDAEPTRIPPSTDEAAALYRSMLARRQFLIVLDNARSAEQVRPLLPGSPGCIVLVTSRNRLPGLIAHNSASHLTVDPLSGEDAASLLCNLIEPSMVYAESAAVTDLAEACGHLPLALRIAATNLAERPDWTLAQYVVELQRGNRLDALQVDGAQKTDGTRPGARAGW